MVKYTRLWETMQRKGISQYRLIKTYGISNHDKRMNDCLPPILFSAIFKLLKVLPDTELDAC